MPRTLTLSFFAAIAAWVLTFSAVAAQPPETETFVYSQYRADNHYDLASQPETNDRIGSALAAGDFDNDGFEDLVIGCAYEDYGAPGSALVNSGWVSVVYGGPLGADARVEDLWDQEGDIEGGPEADDRVGFSVAVGDFNEDQFDDLAIGSPGEDITISGVTDSNSGAVNVIYGSSEGLQHVGNRLFYQERVIGGNAVPGLSEDFDNFGYSLAAGDFNNDGKDDLAIGAPFEKIGSIVDAGAVTILYGKPVIGLDPEDAQGISRNTAGMIGSPTAGDDFAFSLAAGDFNGDGIADLAIGVRDDDEAEIGAGAVDVIYGTLGGLDPTTNEIWTLDTQGVAGVAERGDALGSSLASGDFDGDSIDDLAIGVPDRTTGTTFDHGAALVLYGTMEGLDAAGSQFFGPGIGLALSPVEDGNFAEALAAGDMDGDGVDELLVGIPGQQLVNPNTGNLWGGAGVALLFPGQGGQGLMTSSWNEFTYFLVGNPATSDGFGAKLGFGDFDGDGRDDPVFAVPRRLVPDANGSPISHAGEVLVTRTTLIFADGFESGDAGAWSTSSP